MAKVFKPRNHTKKSVTQLEHSKGGDKSKGNSKKGKAKGNSKSKDKDAPGAMRWRPSSTEVQQAFVLHIDVSVIIFSLCLVLLI